MSVRRGSFPVWLLGGGVIGRGRPKEASLERSECILEKGYLMLRHPRIESWGMLG